MKLILAGLVLVLVLVVGAQAQLYKLPGQAFQGSHDMWRAYRDMKKANTIGADKYFHARGNYDAANRGPGGRWAAKVISNARERIQRIDWRGENDEEADQEANRWGRNGGDPNVYRPRGLDSKY
ncbi:serum amyloid A-5 protein [Paramormyrops kingsleyae]|uniref:Serum amyloid A protein n=1 Tax=Paramormyrops kingsleyae TaxID=1676925 RepID=A0A3B3QYD8_9TELE|nr:serum amyloid A-2 protein [Paramormyrops kingsleyae]